MPSLYLDFMSQPSRACAIFIKLNGLPVEFKTVLIHKGETKGKEFQSKNPLGKVPFLEDETSSLRLPESAAILTYLAGKYSTPQHWYPTSNRESQARVDAALHWYHSNIRAGCARLVFNTVLAPKLGITANPAVRDEGHSLLAVALKQLTSYWLQDGAQKFMCGSQVCLADLLCSCEMEQLCMMQQAVHGTDLEDQLNQFPTVRRWMSDVAAACSPAYEEAHSLLRRAAQSGRAPASASKL
jgi:glutathione S-transferase